MLRTLRRRRQRIITVLPAKPDYVPHMKKLLLISLVVAGALSSLRAQEKILFAEIFSQGISNRWQNTTFFKTPTVYEIKANDN